MIVVDNLSKSYAKQTLFEGISFKVNRKERVGVVGRNGHGKTTLFRLITGEEEADAGTITMPRNYRIGYVAQKLNFRADTVRDEASRGPGSEAAGEMWRVEKVLAGLGFDPKALDRSPAELSGGFQVRLNLARVLLSDNQMLLLDEPNNYLDITSIRWLERFLVDWPGELMLITHDRSFMDKVVTHVLGIHRRKVRKVAGDTAEYYSQIAMEEEVYEKTRQNDVRKQKEMDLFISRFRAKARLAGMVQSRIKSLEKMEKKDKLVAIKDLEFAFTERPFHHKYAMTLDGLTFGYEPGKPLIRDMNLSIGARDRIFVIGRNGKGKTTLLKLMAGVLEPDAGEVVTPQSVAAGYYEQTNVSSLGDANTVLDEIASANVAQDPKLPRLIAGAMMFEGDDALKPVRVLSGGEKSRVMLGKIIAAPVNLLLLDEPTNHLDLESSDALLEALDGFEGAVVMVTHNEMFLHALAERLIVFQDGGLTVYEGGYQRFLEKVGWNEEAERPGRSPAEPDVPAERRNPKGLRKLRSGIIAERSRVLKPLERRMAEVEAEIERNDTELRTLNEAVIEASRAKAGPRVVELSRAMHKTKSATDRLFKELEWLTREHEKKNDVFEERLKALDEDVGAGDGPEEPPGRV